MFTRIESTNIAVFKDISILILHNIHVERLTNMKYIRFYGKIKQICQISRLNT